MATTTGELVFDTSRPSRSLWSDAFRRLSRNKMALVSLFIIVLFTGIAIAAPILRRTRPSSRAAPAPIGAMAGSTCRPSGPRTARRATSSAPTGWAATC